MKSKLRFFYFISKRLFKKKSYLVLLFMVPLLILAMRVIAAEESGVVRIALCREDKSDKTTEEIVISLKEMNSVILFEEFEDIDGAKERLSAGKVDAVWYFKSDMDAKLRDFAEDAGSTKHWEPPVLVFAREDNVALQLSREKLYGVMAPQLYYYMYEDTVLTMAENAGKKPAEDINAIYADSAVLDCLVQFAYIDGTTEENMNYLLTPLRGMLAILIVVSGFAATLFYLQDEENGILDHISHKKRPGTLYLYQFSVMLYVCIAVLAAVFLLGNGTNFLYELAVMGLFILMTMNFCTFWKQLLKYPHRLAVGMLVCIVLILVFCPIFLTIKKFALVQCLLPPYYYLLSIHNPTVLSNMVIYCLLGFFINYFLEIIKEKVEFN